MASMVRLSVMLLAASTAAGCTTQLQGVVPTPDGRVAAGKVPQGYAYQLPDLSYRVIVTRTIVKCPTIDAATFKDSTDKVEFDVKASIETVLRPGQVVVIDYRKMGSALKTTNFDAGNFDTGMIKSVNASIEDHTAAVITEGAKTIVGIGKLAMTLGAPVRPVGPNPPPPLASRIACTDQAAADRVLADQAKADVTKKTAALVAATTALVEANKATDAPAKPAATPPANTAPKDGTATTPPPAATAPAATAAAADIEKKKDAVDAATKALAASQQAFTARMKSLTVTQELVFTPGPDNKAPGIATVTPGSAAGNLMSNSLQIDVLDPGASAIRVVAITAALDPASSASELSTPLQAALADLSVALDFRLAGAWPTFTPANACPNDGKNSCGILYRTMTKGVLVACRGVDPATCRNSANDDAGLLARDERTVPQAGMLVSLPLVNGTLVDNTLKATFREDGTLAAATYTTPKAAAEEGLKAVNAALGSLQGFAEYRRDEPTTAAGREAAYINALAAIDKARNDRAQAARDAYSKAQAEALAAQQEARLRGLVDDTEGQKALAANIEAQTAVEEANAKLAALRKAAAQ